jgi:hypothetical protein
MVWLLMFTNIFKVNVGIAIFRVRLYMVIPLLERIQGV